MSEKPAVHPGPNEYRCEGLRDAVDIIIDRWGVPHIYARNAADLFFAQGFNAARDRLYQIDLWRRRGLGRLAGAFGESFVEQDRASRLFTYRGDTRVEWLSYGSATRRIVTDFTRGINAYVTWVLEDERRLPPEFAHRGHRPELWEPEDISRLRNHGLWYNAEDEMARAITLRDVGPEAEELRHTREPADPLQIPEGLDLDLLRDEMLATYRLAMSPVAFDGRPVGRPLDGSNNWVIDAAHSATGRPIVANDPHRAITLPSLRYVAHLHAPGINVIGGGEPGLPGISVGHNEEVAFGLTIVTADQEDLYIYELTDGDPGAYRYDGREEPFTRITEEIPVAGGPAQEVTLEFTRHGPVIYRDDERGIAVALRTAWLEPGMAPYLSSLEYMTARTAQDFQDALGRWGAPGVNQVYADVHGDFGWQVAALVPRRPNWDGSLPVPGDGRYEWDGFATREELPQLHNPERGWVTTSNEMIVPEGYDNQDLTISYDWYSGGRHRRLADWLTSAGTTGIEDSVRMQMDTLSPEIADICAMLAQVPADTIDPDARELFAELQTWNGSATIDAREPLVFEVWIRRHLRPWLVEATFAGRDLDEKAKARLHAIAHRDESFGPDLRSDTRMLGELLQRNDGVATLIEGINRTLPAAIAQIEGLAGADRGAWRWGAIHHSRMVNVALADALDLPEAHRVAGPVPRGGTGDTPGMTAYNADFNQTLGSSFRIVMDVGEWDNSRAMNSPGQSGDPRSPHYSDLVHAWSEGGTFPLCYSRTAVKEAAERLLRLVP